MQNPILVLFAVMHDYKAGATKYVVGAYPASPAHSNWNPELEHEFFDTLSSDSRIGSLELPWLGSIHPHDDAWLIKHFPNELSAVITDIPFVMSRISQSSNYGLASGDKDGRRAAIGDVQKINDAVRKFNDSRQRKVVSALELHTAPRKDGYVDSLASSLEEIAAWNWDGASLVIEHCDAWIEGQQPEKGFLTIDQEIEAIRKSGVDVGIFINWGRSAIELRDADKVAQQIATVRESGLLQGLIFSGASAQDGIFGPAWIDAHHPFRKNERHLYGDPLSLLTEAQAEMAINAAGTVPWLGIKLGWLKSVEGTIRQRSQMISSALDALDEARGK